MSQLAAFMPPPELALLSMTVAPRATDTVLRVARRVATPQEQYGCSGVAA